jgi:hypothetical protein
MCSLSSYQTKHYSRLSDKELLQKLIGVRQVQKNYRGSLGEVFATGMRAECPSCR